MLEFFFVVAILVIFYPMLQQAEPYDVNNDYEMTEDDLAEDAKINKAQREQLDAIQQYMHSAYVSDYVDKIRPIDTFDQFMSAEDKKAYLTSSKWYALRTKVFNRDNLQCTACGSVKSINCHHITYARLGDENLSDLTTLCGGPDGCHTKLHKLKGYDRTTIYKVSS